MLPHLHESRGGSRAFTQSPVLLPPVVASVGCSGMPSTVHFTVAINPATFASFVHFSSLSPAFYKSFLLLYRLLASHSSAVTVNTSATG
jgi:hypothetical protein